MKNECTLAAPTFNAFKTFNTKKITGCEIKRSAEKENLGIEQLYFFYLVYIPTYSSPANADLRLNKASKTSGKCS